MNAKFSPLLLAALFGISLPAAYAKPVCGKVTYATDSYDNYQTCRYPQTTLQAAYQAWRTDWLKRSAKNKDKYGYEYAKALLPKLPARSRTVDVKKEGLVAITYTISRREAEIEMGYEGGVDYYRFRLRRGYVELRKTMSPD